MSLLIKALAAAEKDKQAEVGKQQAGEYVADDALSFELASPSIKADSSQAYQVDELADFPDAALLLEGKSPEDAGRQKYEDEFDFVLSETPYADSNLSLEEQAGLPLNASPVAKSVATPSDLSKAESLAAKSIDTTSRFGAQVPQAPTAEVSQKAAAKVFVANQTAKAPTSKMALFLLGGVGALLIWLGLQGYTYLQSSPVPNVVLVKPPTPVVAPVVEAAVLPQDTVVASNSNSNTPSSASAANEQESGSQIAASHIDASKNEVTKSEGDMAKAPVAASKDEPKLETKLDVDIFALDNNVYKKPLSKKPLNNVDAARSDSEVSSKHAPVRLVSKLPSAGVDPALLSAYQAYTRGEYAAAQQQYRQVLQHDVRNVDALLGMAAIAQKQGRDADAAGWNQKVLEIEPRNAIAQSALASAQTGTDVVATESRIKNMLAQQPDAANLHAALGNLYAEQNQWASAQESYFNACRYSPNNADYVFNLAISLDQLGKPDLALKQYQRALELINKSGASSPDRAVLETRIQALQ